MPDSSPKRPNVIVFFTDQQRWDTTGVHGNPLELTPNFDRMAQRGTHVYNAITCQPVCAPARASLQTGLYATRTTVFRNGIALPQDQKTLAHHFREAGYRTAYIGKWHLADRDPVAPDQQGGYEYWLAANALEFSSEPYHTVLFDNDGKPVFLPGYRVDALTDAAIRYIDDHQAEPFFLFISYLEPHHQNHLDDYVAPDGYRERYAGRWTPPDLAALGGSAQQHLGGYYGMVKRLDEALGRLLDALKSLGLADDTIVMVYLRPRLPLQDAQRRIQAFVPRGCGAHPDRFSGAGLRRRRAGAPVGEPGGSAAHAARRGRLAGAAGDGRSLHPASCCRDRCR